MSVKDSAEDHVRAGGSDAGVSEAGMSDVVGGSPLLADKPGES